MVVYATVSSIRAVEIIRPDQRIEERIKELCLKAATVDDSDVPALFEELKTLLTKHSEFVRYLAAKTLNRVNKDPSSSKTAA